MRRWRERQTLRQTERQKDEYKGRVDETVTANEKTRNEKKKNE